VDRTVLKSTGLLEERSRRPLWAAIVAYIDAHNDEPKPFRWTKSADEILASLARFAQHDGQPRRCHQLATRTLTAHPA
jgi:hypothetical protein